MKQFTNEEIKDTARYLEIGEVGEERNKYEEIAFVIVSAFMNGELVNKNERCERHSQAIKDAIAYNQELEKQISRYKNIFENHKIGDVLERYDKVEELEKEIAKLKEENQYHLCISCEDKCKYEEGTMSKCLVYKPKYCRHYQNFEKQLLEKFMTLDEIKNKVKDELLISIGELIPDQKTLDRVSNDVASALTSLSKEKK
jgi:polyhydroxyalkanoate synthesis regulator phasin